MIALGRTRRRVAAHLAGAWVFAAAAVVVFAWSTAGPYVRHMLRPLPGEARTLVAPDAAELVDRQITFLGYARTVVHVSAWSVAVLAAVLVAVATVLMLRRRYGQTTRVLGIAWKAQAVWAAVLLLAQVVMLGLGAQRAAAIPEAARLFTFSRAFEAPYLEVGHLYYLAWFVVVGSAAAALTRALSQPG